MATPTIDDYCAASAEYIREASQIGSQRGKAAQLRLSDGLSRATLTSLRATGLGLEGAVAGERTVGGGLRSVAVAGTRGRALILNTPGSPRGAVECTEAVLDILPHALRLLSDEPTPH